MVLFSIVLLATTALLAPARPEPAAARIVVRSLAACGATPAVRPLPAVRTSLVRDLTGSALPSAGSLDSTMRPALLAAADQMVARPGPIVGYPGARQPQLVWQLTGSAVRRAIGVLGYAWTVTRQDRYRNALRNKVMLEVVSWPTWGKAELDRAGTASGIAMAYSWLRPWLPAETRKKVVAALRDRMVLPWVCPRGAYHHLALAPPHSNHVTVTAAAVVLASLAILPDDPVTGSAGVASAADVLRRKVTAPQGWGVAGGPTNEGLMYTDYELSALAPLVQTARLTASPEIRLALAGIDGLSSPARWMETCAKLNNPMAEDTEAWYWHIDRASALAGLRSQLGAGSNVGRIYLAEQARSKIAPPVGMAGLVPDGIAALIDLGTPVVPKPPPSRLAYVASPRYGCVNSGASSLYAFLSAVPNQSVFHSHQDLGNVIVMSGEEVVLGDLGRQEYGFSPTPGTLEWRTSSAAHSVVTVEADSGWLEQLPAAAGSIVVTQRSWLRMTAPAALPGVSWKRQVGVGASTVIVADTLAASARRTVVVSFLLHSPAGLVEQASQGVVRFEVPASEGVSASRWSLTLPSEASVTVEPATPPSGYSDSPEPDWYAPWAIVRARVAMGPGETVVLRSRLEPQP
ncbi:unannotated protein [freshwater metagenome]|uniref:Unannotated protein n=1 Tax=freshwater metagenome TaxID=449393 RepID=A0A6J7IXQ4_9ZZZZ